MNFEQQVENLIERIRPLMPSAGIWPFTVIVLNRNDFHGLSFEHSLNAKYQLLFLLRTDFNRNDLVDYLASTEEFYSIPGYRQENYLNEFVNKIEHGEAFSNWRERIVHLGIGIAVGLSSQLDLCIEELSADLSEVDTHFDFANRNLKAFKFFDIYSCKD